MGLQPGLLQQLSPALDRTDLPGRRRRVRIELPAEFTQPDHRSGKYVHDKSHADQRIPDRLQPAVHGDESQPAVPRQRVGPEPSGATAGHSSHADSAF